MTDVVARFAQATAFFGDQVHAVPAGSWQGPTPCSEWNVHDLANHVVSEHLWAPPLIAGQTIAEVGTRFDGDLLGTDPGVAWDSAARGSVAAIGAPGALDGIVHLSYGDDGAASYVMQMTLDALIHGWDLARSIGLPALLPADLVTWAIGVVEPMVDLLAVSGVFGEPLPVADDADDQTRLLAMLGRDAAWSA